MSAIHYLGDHDNSLGSQLMRHIRDNPDDETGKLVFADWLMENGHPEVGSAIHMHHNQMLRDRGDVLPFGTKWKGEHKGCNHFANQGTSHSIGDGSTDPIGGVNGHFYTSDAYDSDVDKELPKLANVSIMLRMPKSRRHVSLADFKTPHLDIAKSVSDELIENERQHERQDATDRGRDELKANFDKHCDQHGTPETPKVPQEAKQMAKKKFPSRFAESEQPAFESTGTQLLRHIAENPDDETSKLVYADWLEENGYPETAGAIRMHHDKRLRDNGDVVDDDSHPNSTTSHVINLNIADLYRSAPVSAMISMHRYTNNANIGLWGNLNGKSVKVADFSTPHADIVKAVSDELVNNGNTEDETQKANFDRIATHAATTKPAKMSKRHQQAAKDILSKHSKFFSSNCEKQKDGEYLCKGDSSEPGDVADQFARAAHTQHGMPTGAYLPPGAPITYGGLSDLLEPLRGEHPIHVVLHTDVGAKKNGKNDAGEKISNPWTKITKYSRVKGVINGDYVRRAREEAAKRGTEYVPGSTWHERNLKPDGSMGAFTTHADGKRYLSLIDPVDMDEPEYYGHYEDGTSKKLVGEELEHAKRFFPVKSSVEEPLVKYRAPALPSIKHITFHDTQYRVKHDSPEYDATGTKPESATPPKSIEPPMPARTPEKPSRPETAPTLPMAAKIAPGASESERKPMPEFDTRKALEDMQDEPRKKVEPDDSGNDVSVDKEEPSHIERITKGFHPTIAGTRLAHHLDKIRTEFAGDDHIADLANRAISGDWKTGNDPDVFKQLGEALKEKGSPWGTAYRWGQAYKGLQLDGKIKDMVDKKLKGGQGNHYRKLALMLGEYMKNPTEEHKFQSDPRWKEFYDGMIKTTQESLHSDKFPGRNVDALGALYRSLLRNGFREEDREDAKNDPDYKKGFDYLPGWQGGPSQADKATHNAERFQKKPDVPPPLPPSGKKPIQTPDHLYPDKSKPAQPPLPSGYMPKQSPVGKEAPKKFGGFEDFERDLANMPEYRAGPASTKHVPNKGDPSRAVSPPKSSGSQQSTNPGLRDNQILDDVLGDGPAKNTSKLPPPVPKNSNSQHGTPQDLADHENDINRTGGQSFAPMASPLPRPQPNGRTPFREPTPQDVANSQRQTKQDVENRKNRVGSPVYDIPATFHPASTPPPLPKGYVPKTSPVVSEKPRNPNKTFWYSDYHKGGGSAGSGFAGYVSHSNPESDKKIEKAKTDGMHVATVYQPMPDGTRKPVTSYIGRTPQEAMRLGELHVKLTKLKRDAQKESGSKSPRDIWKSGGGKYWNQAKPILEEMRKLLGKPASPGKKFNPETGHNERTHPGLPVEGSKLILSKRHQPNKRGHRK